MHNGHFMDLATHQRFFLMPWLTSLYVSQIRKLSPLHYLLTNCFPESKTRMRKTEWNVMLFEVGLDFVSVLEQQHK